MANPADKLGERLDALAAVVGDVLTAAVSAAAAATQKFAVGLSALTGSVTKLATGPLVVLAEKVTDCVNKVGSALTTLAAGPVSAFGASVGLAVDKVGQLAVAVAQLGAGPIAALSASINQSIVVPFANLANALGGLISGPFGAARDQVLNATQGLGGLVGGMAGFRDAVTAVPQQMAAFVGALSPGLLVQFNYAVATLNATIGAALAPALQVFSSVIQNVAGQIAPVMHQLAPVLAQFAQTIGAAIVPIVGVMAAALQACMPLFQFLADVLRDLVPLYQAMGVIVQATITTIGDLLKSFFGGADAKNAMDSFRNAIAEVAKQLVLLSVRLAAAFGDAKGKGGYIDNVTKALTDQIAAATGKLKGDAPAPTGAGTSSLEAIAKQIGSLSFLAGGGPVDDHPEVAQLERILEAVKGISQDSLGRVIYQAVDNFWEKIFKPWLEKTGADIVGDNPYDQWIRDWLHIPGHNRGFRKGNV